MVPATFVQGRSARVCRRVGSLSPWECGFRWWPAKSRIRCANLLGAVGRLEPEPAEARESALWCLGTRSPDGETRLARPRIEAVREGSASSRPINVTGPSRPRKPATRRVRLARYIGRVVSPSWPARKRRRVPAVRRFQGAGPSGPVQVCCRARPRCPVPITDKRAARRREVQVNAVWPLRAVGRSLGSRRRVCGRF